jgi:hypothetical protein
MMAASQMMSLPKKDVQDEIRLSLNHPDSGTPEYTDIPILGRSDEAFR